MSGDQELTLQDLLDMLPQLVNAAVRASMDKPPLPQHGLVSIKTGVVVSADDTSALVQLDDEPADNPVSVQLATLADISDRVIVFTRHGGGAYAIGNGQAADNLPPAPVVAVDTYKDSTGVSIGPGASAFLPWVDAGGAPWLPSAGLLIPGTYLGNIGAEVIADGEFTFEVEVGANNGVGLAAAELLLIRPPTTALDQSASILPATSGPLKSLVSMAVEFSCVAGDLIFVVVQTALGALTTDYFLFASVKSRT